MPRPSLRRIEAKSGYVCGDRLSVVDHAFSVGGGNQQKEGCQKLSTGKRKGIKEEEAIE